MYLLDIGHDVIAALRSLMFSIFESLLRAILSIYNIFMAVAEHELFNDDTIQLIYTRVGLILGLFMVFRLTFSAIEYLINPDTMNDKQKGIGNVIKKVLIVVILLGSVNALFDQAYNIQKIVLKNEDNLISKIILGPSENKDAEENESGEGVALVWTIFKSFYVPIDGVGDTCKNTINDDGTVKPYLYDKPVTTNAFDIANECITKESGESWVIQFDWLFGIATAIFILWTLLIYTIQVGVRCIQLAYLELIAPIPIMMYLNPKGDDTLKKWGTQCLITYIDVFIRMAILYFIILIIRTIEESNLFDGGGFSVGIVLLLALFLFVKKVPELIKEIFPSIGGKASLDFGIKNPKQAWNDLKSVPVLGLGAKGIGYGVNKGYKTYKTKNDEIRKARRQARTDLREYNRKDKLGMELHNTYGDTLPSSAFSAKEYQDSYNAVGAAKAKVKETEIKLENAQAEFSAAYNSNEPGREARIAAARVALDDAKKQNKAAQTKLDIANEHHKHMKTIHAKDARIEDAYKHYGDLNPTLSSNSQDNRATSSQMDLNTAASITGNPNANIDDQIKAAEALDRAARERNNNNNNNK